MCHMTLIEKKKPHEHCSLEQYSYLFGNQEINQKIGYTPKSPHPNNPQSFPKTTTVIKQSVRAF